MQTYWRLIIDMRLCPILSPLEKRTENLRFSVITMEKFDSISHFLQSGEFQYCIYDMGRKVSEISNQSFAQIENQEIHYPFPFQQKAWLALLFWPENKEQDAVIWFLQFPIDELGFLKQSARDAFLIDLLEQTGKNIQAKQKGDQTQDALNESPFAFKPREDRLAMFHALATTILKQEPSQHYQYAREYLLAKEQGGPGLEQWQFLGLQGIADVVARLNVDDNQTRLSVAIAEMPEMPLSSYAQALENVVIEEKLFNAIDKRIDQEVNLEEVNISLVAALIRAISSYPSSQNKTALLTNILASKLGQEIEIIAAISGRSWVDLKDEKLRHCFVEALSQQGQMAFSAIIADLIMIPGMRDLVLGEMRSENRSAELAKKFGAFMTGVSG